MFLAPLSVPDSAGLDLRNDTRFLALERALDGASRAVRAAQVAKGNTGDVPLEWAKLLEDAAALAEAGRDLRLLVIAARIMTNLDGPAGLAEGLNLLGGALEDWWDNLHPALRDGKSPRESALRRINALYQIENSDAGILGDLDFNTMLAPRGLPVVSGGDLAAGAVSQAILAAEGKTGLSPAEQAERAARHEARVARVMTACRASRDLEPEAVSVLETGLDAALAALARLETALAARIGDEPPTRFAALRQMLQRMQAALASPAAQLAPASGSPGNAAEPENVGPAPAQMPVSAGAQPMGLPARLSSRREVETCLDLVIDFYERNEPASPLPHLARRMKRMVSMNFLELIEELAPGGMKEFRNVAGVTEDKGR
ncbi:type VI secretion system ImpA family N-terminal domain-containing protein [Paracoccus sp. MC1854]|uniref:type VI secretion system protein TssA n=1 Tax=Paracoccus sp. MC1854 TaxID=2760306 RepID=UPI001603CA29|nr:type VI secretion system ImpA family N-terminal domain-containing protein [Paracoccus sp. MC1854]MBB1490596.1 type VI secretion system ImpA family N-terminal domain-containing protein [Paracoccus sp. MC1854]